ncbi:hypothetical protein COO60DRAFT_31162 [Scenedesmus sp. NREL 46B-D3]|nr:hypothetical protein COO60DRAFT_31162 [Scenedesmus sp. NREL 46B-D3]
MMRPARQQCCQQQQQQQHHRGQWQWCSSSRSRLIKPSKTVDKQHGLQALSSRQQLDGQPAQSVAGTLELFAISDLHTDYPANMEWVQQLDMTSRAGSNSSSSSSSSSSSVLIVAGDVSDDMGRLRATLEALTSKFSAVAFVPGNHELWVKGASEQATALRNGGATDSVAKLHRVLRLCKELGVITQPTQLGGCWWCRCWHGITR